jgi:eukaryotic-like serine/threonine-protein kinase
MSALGQPPIGDQDLSEPDALVDNPLVGTKYRAVTLIGRGGMGEVYLADHGELGKRFVVKLLHAEMATDPRLVDRTRVEAQTLAKLRHPSIVDVVDFGTTPDGRPYLVMERLTGTTLADEVRQRGALGAVEAVALVRQVLGALGAAHAIGIIHRDIKLSNLFMHHPPARAPVLKVLDFGLAKVLDGASNIAPAPLRFPTEEGVVLGTPRYLAPEAWAGKGVDHRADIYATGVVLYHLLCGRGPWEELRRHADVLDAQLAQRFDPPSTHAPEPIPAELDWIVQRSLSASPADRFQSAEAFDDTLRAIADAARSPTGWMHTTVLREPDSRGSAHDLAELDGTSGDTDRALPPTEALGGPGAPRHATQKLDSDACRPGPDLQDAPSTQTALRIPAAGGNDGELERETAEPNNVAAPSPPSAVAATASAAAGAVAIGLIAWLLLTWLGGR